MDKRIKCLVLDDEPLAKEVMEHYVGMTPFLELAGSFEKPLEALHYMQANPVDILLTDIKMPKIDGLQLINSLSKKPLIIFVTAYRDYALESFDSGVIDYLIKPVPYERFLKAVVRAKDFLTIQPENQTIPLEEEIDRIFIKADGKLVKILFKDIVYIESLKDYLKFYISNTEQYITYATLKVVEEKLPEYFFRIQRSYIINTKNIQSFFGNTVRMKYDNDLPISITLKQELYEKLGIAKNSSK